MNRLRPDDLGLVVLALAVLLPVLPVLWWYRRRSRDEMFDGITPGELPGIGHQVRRVRVGGGGLLGLAGGPTEWSGPVAVRFTPPDGVTPGLAGTVIDGRADVADLSAALIDLAVRGHFRISPGAPAGAPAGAPVAAHPAQRPAKEPTAAQTKRDYVLTCTEPPLPIDQLRQFEQTLLLGLFAQGPVVHLRDLGPDFAQRMREAQVGLYREVVDRRWYTEHPRMQQRKLGCLLTPVLVLVAVVAVAVVWQLRTDGEASLVGLAFPAGLLVAAYLLFRGARKRSARTAEGTAVRIQTLGFREYLTKAEASQIRFDQARDLFSRYLPYAIVFGVADRWARVFGEVAAHAHAAGWADAWFDLSWFDATDLLFDGAGNLISALDGDSLGSLAQLGDLGDLGGLVDGLGDTLAHFADGVGDFASSATSLLDVGDGCGSGCDGCDLPGCDF